MRHGNKFNHLGRKAGHRAALLSSLAFALIKHKRISTTLAKAKALRVYVEPLITKSKENTTHSRRTVFSYLGKKEAIIELFDVIGPKVADRPGGYTRIIRMGFRRGDAAAMAMIELVDFNELMLASKKSGGEKIAKRTRRRSSSKAVETPPAVLTPPTVVTPPVMEEAKKEEE